MGIDRDNMLVYFQDLVANSLGLIKTVSPDSGNYYVFIDCLTCVVVLFIHLVRFHLQLSKRLEEILLDKIEAREKIALEGVSEHARSAFDSIMPSIIIDKVDDNYKYLVIALFDLFALLNLDIYPLIDTYIGQPFNEFRPLIDSLNESEFSGQIKRYFIHLGVKIVTSLAERHTHRALSSFVQDSINEGLVINSNDIDKLISKLKEQRTLDSVISLLAHRETTDRYCLLQDVLEVIQDAGPYLSALVHMILKWNSLSISCLLMECYEERNERGEIVQRIPRVRKTSPRYTGRLLNSRILTAHPRKHGDSPTMAEIPSLREALSIQKYLEKKSNEKNSNEINVFERGLSSAHGTLSRRSIAW